MAVAELIKDNAAGLTAEGRHLQHFDELLIGQVAEGRRGCANVGEGGERVAGAG